MTSCARLAFTAAGLLGLLGCSGADNAGGPSGVGGSAATISSTATAGDTSANKGGTNATGGNPTSIGSAPSNGGSVGGQLGLGSNVGLGGATATGGFLSAGGNSVSGGNGTIGGKSSMGGTAVTGGSSFAAGSVLTGGNKATGSSSSAGGVAAAAGAKATGGAPAAGGVTSTGGANATGGNTASGGASNAGGSSGTCIPSTCGSHNWACWHMPNPAGLGLPNPSSYTDLGDGTVRDNVTCLVWQKASLVVGSTNTFTFADAQTACASSTLAGKTWRTATRVELTSIVDFSRTSGVAINATYFTALSGYTWTATPWVVSQIATKPQNAWMINFADGLTSNGAAQAGTYYTRCVTSGDGTTSSSPAIPPNQYATLATGEIQDNYTGLIWQEADSVSTMTQPEAITYCASLALNGHGGWRLPSIHEIATLVDDNPPITKVTPAINQIVFPTTAGTTPYWTSSLYKGQAVSAHAPWTLSFTDGFTNYSKTAGIAKCVR